MLINGFILIQFLQGLQARAPRIWSTAVRAQQAPSRRYKKLSVCIEDTLSNDSSADEDIVFHCEPSTYFMTVEVRILGKHVFRGIQKSLNFSPVGCAPVSAGKVVDWQSHLLPIFVSSGSNCERKHQERGRNPQAPILGPKVGVRIPWDHGWYCSSEWCESSTQGRTTSL